MITGIVEAFSRGPKPIFDNFDKYLSLKKFNPPPILRNKCILKF